MLNSKRFVGAILSLLIALVFAAAAALAQATSPVELGGNLGEVTFTSNNSIMSCYYANYYLGSWHYTYRNYWHDIYSNFVYVPDSSTGLPSQAFGGTEVVISDSPGPGIEQQDTCPANQPGQTITYSSSTDGSGYTVSVTPVGSDEVYAGIGVPGYINPKWQVVGVTYAPPWSSNSVNYANSTMVGTSNSVSSTWSLNNSVSTSLAVGTSVKIKGFSDGTSVTSGTTKSWTQGGNSSTSVTVSSTVGNTLQVGGGPSPYAGLDHDYDLVWIWLNPVANFTMGNGGVPTWNGYGYATADTDSSGDMGVSWVELGCLNGAFDISICGQQTYGYCQGNTEYNGDPSACPSGEWYDGVMVRKWANTETFDSPDATPNSPPPGYGPWSLSDCVTMSCTPVNGQSPPSDLQTIAEADPWHACTFSSAQPPAGQDWTADCPSPNPNDTSEPNITELTDRFATAASSPNPLQYNQGAPVNQGVSYNNVTTESQTDGTSSQESFGWELAFEKTATVGTLFQVSFDTNITYKGKLTYGNDTNNQFTKTITSTASLSLQGPPCNQQNGACNPAYPPGQAYWDTPDHYGTPMSGYGPAFGQATEFHVYEDLRYGTFLLQPVY